jgi:hypothetical protein
VPVDYQIVPITSSSDTGEPGTNTPAVDAIYPMEDGVDPLNAAALNRDVENLRNRTEVARKFLNDHEAVLTDNLGLTYCLDLSSGAAAALHWDGAYVSGSANTGINGSGAVWLDSSSTLHIAPINSPAVNVLAGVVCYTTLASNGIALTANWLNVFGGNTIELQVIYSSVAGSSATVALAGGNSVGIPVDMGGSSLLQRIIQVTVGPATTWATVGTAITATSLAGGSSGLVTVTQTGSWSGSELVVPSPPTVPGPFSLSGGADAERHDIPAGNMSISGSPPTVRLKSGDGLAVMFGNWDYRRSQVASGVSSFLTAATNLGGNVSAYPFFSALPSSGTTVPGASIVNTTTYPNLITYAIPLARVSTNGELLLASGEVIPAPASGSSVSDIGGFAPAFTTTNNNPYLTGQTLTLTTGTELNQIQQVASDINGLVSANIGSATLTGSPTVASGSVQNQLQDIYTDVLSNTLDIAETTTNIGNYFTQGAVQFTAPTLTCTTPLSAFIDGTYYSLVTPAPLTLTLGTTPNGIIAFNGTSMIRTTSYDVTTMVLIGYWTMADGYYGPGAPGTSGTVCQGGWAMGSGAPIKVKNGGPPNFNFATLDDAFAFAQAIQLAEFGSSGAVDRTQEIWVYDASTAFGSTASAQSIELENFKIIGKNAGPNEIRPRIRVNATTYLTLSLFNCAVENIAFDVLAAAVPASNYTASSPANATYWIISGGSRFTNCTFDGYNSAGTSFTTPLCVDESDNYHRSEFYGCTFMNTTDAAVIVRQTIGLSESQAGGALDHPTLFQGCSFENNCTGQSATANPAASGAILVGTVYDTLASVVVDSCSFYSCNGYCVYAGAYGGNSLHISNTLVDSTVAGIISTYNCGDVPDVYVDNVHMYDTQPQTFLSPMFLLWNGGATDPAFISNCDILLQRVASVISASGTPVFVSDSNFVNIYGGVTGARLPTLLYLNCIGWNISNSNISWGASSGATWINGASYLINILGAGVMTGCTISSTATQTNAPSGSLGTTPSPLIKLANSCTLTGNIISNGQAITVASGTPLSTNNTSVMSCGIYWNGTGSPVISGNLFYINSPTWGSNSSPYYGSGYGVMAGIFADNSSAETGAITITGNQFYGSGGGSNAPSTAIVDNTGVYLGGPIAVGTNDVTAEISGNSFINFQNGGILGWWSSSSVNPSSCNINVAHNYFIHCGSNNCNPHSATLASAPAGALHFESDNGSHSLESISVVGNSFNDCFGSELVYNDAGNFSIPGVTYFLNCINILYSGNVLGFNCQGVALFYNAAGIVNGNTFYNSAATEITVGGGANVYSATMSTSSGAITANATSTPASVTATVLFLADISYAGGMTVTGNVIYDSMYYDAHIAAGAALSGAYTNAPNIVGSSSIPSNPYLAPNWSL